MKQAETLFETGDKVFTIKDMKIVEGTIEEAKITIKKDIVVVAYYLERPEEAFDITQYPESVLFKSRELLLKSL